MRVDHLIATQVTDPVPREDPREPVRVVLASLALGGAERIVVEWLGAEAAAGRACELALVHTRRLALAVPRGVDCIERGALTVAQFMAELGRRWVSACAPVSTHLIGDDLLALLWQAGLRTVPVVHNAPEGWRNDPRRWDSRHVPLVVACAGAVKAELEARGCVPPVLALRHRPAGSPAASDVAVRQRMRAEAGIAAHAFVVLAVGAIKAQKHYVRAIEVLARLVQRRDAVLVIAGGVLDAAGLRELDAIVDAAARAGVDTRLRLPGFVDPIAPWFAAADALINVSRYEGLSMAVREALAAGLPVVATDVGGQRENDAEHLVLLPRDAPSAGIAAALAALPLRTELAARPVPRLPRLWSLTLAGHRPQQRDIDTLLVTANLNAGGAQRSLVNLAGPLARRMGLAVAVTGPSTQAHFACALEAGGVRTFRCTDTAEPLAAAEVLLARAARSGARTLCFWNVDARIKLLVAGFAPPGLRLIDVSPGDYAFAELEAALPWARAFDMGAAGYYGRLDTLVLKYRGERLPAGVRTQVIPNGVALRAPRKGVPPVPRFLVSGRLAPSKRLDIIVAAFAHMAALRSDAELHLVGSAEPRHVDHARDLVRQAQGLRVVFHGAQPDLDFLAEPWTAAVVLGTHQGSPNAVLEAMAAGLPVIANASGGTGEMVIDGHSGWLLPEACTAEELAGAMFKAAADPVHNARLGQAARAFVAAHHGIASMVTAYEALFAGASGEQPVLQAA